MVRAIVIAAVLGLRLRPDGILITGEQGRGQAFYEYRKPKAEFTDPVGLELYERFVRLLDRKNSIVAALAGQIAQEQFDPDSPDYAADDKEYVIEPLLQEEQDENPASNVREELRTKAVSLVAEHLEVIQKSAEKLLDKSMGDSQLPLEEMIPF
jgi:hypothetical protein